MNSTGKSLTQIDLIRNYILMDIEPKKQTEFYENYWYKIEKIFGQENYDTYFNSFAKDYLILKTRNKQKKDEVYENFKKYYNTQRQSLGSSFDIETLLKDMYKTSIYYCNIAMENKESDRELDTAFRAIRELKVTVSYPFFMEVYDDYKNNTISKDQFLAIIRLIENFIFRRSICNLTKELNSIFPTLSKNIDKTDFLKNLELKLSRERFPSDLEFRQKLQERNMYGFNNKDYFFSKLENFNKKEKISISDYTIEHIMPQTLTKEWERELGGNYEEIHEAYLNKLGNLTLTGYNSEYSNRTFKEKRDTKNGFANSPLKLNEGLGQIKRWNEKAIKERGERLAKFALQVWPRPNINQEEIRAYKQQNKKYTLYDHTFYARDTLGKELFEKVDRLIKELNPNIERVIQKKHINYKLNGAIFAYINIQEKTLKLVLNIKKAELDDPLHLVRDISGKGKYGTGNSEVKMQNLEETPSIMTLIKQSYNKCST